MNLPKRKLQFLAQSIGLLYLSDDIDSGQWDWDNYYQAAGIIKIPEGQMVKLDISSKALLSDVTNVFKSLECDAIQELVITGKQFNNSILNSISNLTELIRLRFVITSIDNLEDLNLSNLNKLLELTFLFTQIGCIGMLKIINVKKLEFLCLSGCNLCNDCLIHLKDLIYLKHLSLRLNNISDEGVLHLVKLTHLHFLDLSGTQISDDGLMSLVTLSHLQELLLESTFISNKGVDNFKTYLPKCNVYLKPSK